MARREAGMQSSKEVVEAAKAYLLTCIVNGLCPEFHQLRHGPSLAWTTACVGSTLAEFQAVPREMLEAILSLRWDSGGWSYNQNSMPDADSTLRVLQFLAKTGFSDQEVISKAELFVIAHQHADGGIATYLPEVVAKMGYPEGGWTTSHPCVTALAARVLQNKQARRQACLYIADRLESADARAYWWRTPWYVRYESGVMNGETVGTDPVEMGLALLLEERLGRADSRLTASLAELQLSDGSFPPSHQFRIPRPNQFLNDITEETETIEDRTRIFSTAAAVVAIARQEALLH